MVGQRISDAIEQDHQEIMACYGRIVNSSVRDEQIRFQNLFTWDLARLLVGEEIVVYPALEKHLSDGVSLAEKDRKVHQTVKEELKEFQNLDPSNSSFVPTIQGLMNHVSQHIKEEEENQLPRLEAALSEDQSDGLRKSFNRTKIFMPSRAHPHAPSKPPFETVVGLLTAPVDQLGDLVRKWPHHA